MKKTLTICSSILLVLFVLLSLLDKSDYTIEKKFWHLHKSFQQLTLDPGASPNQRFDQIANDLLLLAKQTSNKRIAARIYLEVGTIFTLKKDYEKAREYFNEILEHHSDLKKYCAQALTNIAKTYEEENNPGMVIDHYKRIMVDYPLTEAGLKAPINIANFYIKRGDTRESFFAQNNAITFYEKVIEKHPKTIAEYKALKHLTEIYTAQKSWPSAVQTMGKLLLHFPSRAYLTNDNAQLLVKSINRISTLELKDYDTPIRIYTQFLQENENHPFKKYFNQQIKHLKKLKSQNIELKPSS